MLPDRRFYSSISPSVSRLFVGDGQASQVSKVGREVYVCM